MTTATTPISAAPAARRATDIAIPGSRLVAVELRKMVDTRAGRWVLASVPIVMALTLIVGAATGDPDQRSFVRLLALAQQPTSALLPILGILAATTEWSRRTVLTTFALLPSRPRLLAAKVAASQVLVLATVMLTVVFAALVAAFAPALWTTQSDWGVGLSDLGEYVAYQSLYMLIGISIGSLLMNTPASIVTFLMFPTIWMAVISAFPKLDDVQRWADTGTAWEHLVADAPMTATWWARVGTTALIWLALPLAFGIRRQLRREVD